MYSVCVQTVVCKRVGIVVQEPETRQKGGAPYPMQPGAHDHTVRHIPTRTSAIVMSSTMRMCRRMYPQDGNMPMTWKLSKMVVVNRERVPHHTEDDAEHRSVDDILIGAIGKTMKV